MFWANILWNVGCIYDLPKTLQKPFRYLMFALDLFNFHASTSRKSFDKDVNMKRSLVPLGYTTQTYFLLDRITCHLTLVYFQILYFVIFMRYFSLLYALHFWIGTTFSLEQRLNHCTSTLKQASEFLKSIVKFCKCIPTIITIINIFTIWV